VKANFARGLASFFNQHSVYGSFFIQIIFSNSIFDILHTSAQGGVIAAGGCGRSIFARRLLMKSNPYKIYTSKRLTSRHNVV
jgi:hypothetical protein